MLPPVPEAPNDMPVLETAMASVTPIGMEPDAAGATVTVTVAATPFPITLVLLPDARHRYPPDVPAQFSDLPAVVKTEPAASWIEVTLPEG